MRAFQFVVMLIPLRAAKWSILVNTDLSLPTYFLQPATMINAKIQLTYKRIFSKATYFSDVMELTEGGTYRRQKVCTFGNLKKSKTDE